MKTLNKNFFIAGKTLVIGSALALSLAGVAQAEIKNINASLYGNTWGEWSAQWAQWMLSIPKATNPTLDPSGAFCEVGQSGPVWFLAGTSGGDATRSCTIPAGKALFFPIANGMFGSAVFDCEPTAPGVPCNMNAIRKAAADATDAVFLEATVDGKKLSGMNKMRVTSPEYTVTFPADNVVDVPAGSYTPNVANGYYVMLKPLTPGIHRINFKWQFLEGAFAGSSGNVTYNLIVKK